LDVRSLFKFDFNTVLSARYVLLSVAQMWTKVERTQ